jgi:NTE family protein
MGWRRPRKLGLALGGGSARGLAHAGVLKVLDEAGLKPDVIAGTSMGAVVGAMYAAGMSGAELEQIALTYDTRELTGLTEVALGKGAMLSGEKAEAFLAQHMPATFEELGLPFGCVATDLVRGTCAHFTSGNLVACVRASSSVPLAFLPVRVGDSLYVDGFLTDPVPVALARELGAEVVVAVSVLGSGTVVLGDEDHKDSGIIRDLHAALKGEQEGPRHPSALGVMSASVEVAERAIAAPSLEDADLVVEPAVAQYASFEYARAPEIVAAGEEAARAALPKIRRLARR